MEELENLQELKARLKRLSLTLEILMELNNYLKNTGGIDATTWLEKRLKQVTEERQEIDAHVQILIIQKDGKR